MKTVYDRRPLTQSAQMVSDVEDQQDDHDDQCPPVNQLHPRVREYMQRTSGKEEYAPPSHQDRGMELYPSSSSSSKGKGYKGKRDPTPMSNRLQPPYKFSKYDNPAASQRVLELARGKTKLPPKPLPPSRQVVSDPELMPPTDLTRGQVGIPPISEEPIKLFIRLEAVRESYNLIAPNPLPPSGHCLPFEDMERLLRKYMPANEQCLPIHMQYISLL